MALFVMAYHEMVFILQLSLFLMCWTCAWGLHEKALVGPLPQIAYVLRLCRTGCDVATALCCCFG